MKILKSIIIPTLLMFFMSCDGDRQNANIGGSIDTAHEEGAIIKPTNPPDSTKGKDSTAKGNVDPSGSMKKSN